MRYDGQEKERGNYSQATPYCILEDQTTNTEGVALRTSSRMEKILLEWKPLGSRLLKARFNSRYTKLTVIVCYAPTEDTDEVDKDDFYKQLQAATEDVKLHDIMLIIGDLNTKVGDNNTGRERVMGRHG